MGRAEEELMEILRLQCEWCRKYGYGYLSTAAFDGCRGYANTSYHEPNLIDIHIMDEAETPAAGTAGESK